jgi:catechol 2,3-dioxygenase-like lactoylglutathione lyase family enzyme
MNEIESLPNAFHLSLNVSDLERSRTFYAVLLGCDPVKVRPDYVKFETSDPALVLSLLPGRPDSSGPVNHAGLRVSGSETLVAIQHRLEAAGFATRREDGVVCCYAEQTKFWILSPDRLLWEIYVFHTDVDDEEHHCAENADKMALAEAGKPEAESRRRWSRSLEDGDLPDAIPFAANWFHEVNLEGIGNLRPAPDLGGFYAEVFRVLRPGGEVQLHGLSADRGLQDSAPNLPGAAAAVRHVPSHHDVAHALASAGFRAVRFSALSERGYFELEGVPLREFRLTAVKPGHRPKATAHQAIYLGPLAEVTDDFGNRFVCGEPVRLNVHDWTALKQGGLADSFHLT